MRYRLTKYESFDSNNSEALKTSRTCWSVVPKPSEAFREEFGEDFCQVGHIEPKKKKFLAVAYVDNFCVTRKFKHKGRALRWVARNHKVIPVVFVQKLAA